MLLCTLVSAEVLAEAHSAVLLVLPPPCCLSCQAQNFAGKAACSDPVALQPPSSLFVLYSDSVRCHNFQMHVRRNFYVPVHIWSRQRGTAHLAPCQQERLKSCLPPLRQKPDITLLLYSSLSDLLSCYQVTKRTMSGFQVVFVGNTDPPLLESCVQFLCQP